MHSGCSAGAQMTVVSGVWSPGSISRWLWWLKRVCEGHIYVWIHTMVAPLPESSYMGWFPSSLSSNKCLTWTTNDFSIKNCVFHIPEGQIFLLNVDTYILIYIYTLYNFVGTVWGRPFYIPAWLCPRAQSKVYKDMVGWVWCGRTWQARTESWPQTHETPLGWSGTEEWSQTFSSKGIIHPKMKILSFISYHHVVPNPYCSSSKHKLRYF